MHARRCLAATASAVVLLTAACQIHSPGQLELARKLLDRYTASFSEALAVTESLPAEEERLMTAYRSNYKLIAATSEAEILESSWSDLAPKAEELNKRVEAIRVKRSAEAVDAQSAAEHLRAIRKPMEESLKKLNAGLKDSDAAPTLKDKLDHVAKAVDGALPFVGAIQEAIQKAAEAAASRNLNGLKEAAERLKPMAPNIQKYFETAVKGPSRAPGQNAPLAVEATRLARDILVVELDILDEEIAYQENLADLAAQTLRSLPAEKRLDGVVQRLRSRAAAAGDEIVAAALKGLAAKGDTQEEALRVVLNDAGTLYYAGVQSARADDMHRIRASVLAYRQAKLLDLAYDRQRRTLISYGLLTAVRYAEGGWKSQDTANLLGLIHAGLQSGLLARL